MSHKDYVFRRKVGGVWWYLGTRRGVIGQDTWFRNPTLAHRYISVPHHERDQYRDGEAIEMLYALLTDPDGIRSGLPEKKEDGNVIQGSEP